MPGILPPHPLRRALRRTALVALGAALVVPPVAVAGTRPVVAVIDTGVDLRHPALRDHAWTNPREIAGNRVDDDGNGFVDDVHGADFIERDGRPADPRGHGTHIAGLIARRGGGRRLGRPSGARIMALRVLGPDGTGPNSTLIEAIHYAVDHGARAINMSVAYYDGLPAMREAVERASAAGVLMTASAGNGRENLDRNPVYPASFRTPTTIVVGAAFGGGLESWSARGRRSVDIAAPGTDLRSSLPGGRYGRRSGTSQATAVVTRVAVRAMRARPAASAREIRRALLAGTRKTARLEHTVASGGRLDARGALSELLG